jgi:hypothetical protein
MRVPPPGGGVLAAPADLAMGQALRSSSGDDEVPATSQLTVTYLRPGQPGRSVVTEELRTRGESSACALRTSSRTAAGWSRHRHACHPAPPSPQGAVSLRHLP